MAKLADIERAIDHLSAGDLARLRYWLDAFEGRGPDERLAPAAALEEDRLLAELAADTLAEHKSGRSRRL